MNDDLFSIIDEHEGRGAGKSNIWNLLAQILLPLVILISFVAIGLIRTAGEYVRTQMQIQESAVQQLHACRSADTVRDCEGNLAQTRALNQWQVLRLALDDKIPQERKKFGFDNFRDADSIAMNGAKLASPELQSLSKNVKNKLGTPEPLREHVTALYRAVLNETGGDKSPTNIHLTDPGLTTSGGTDEFRADLDAALSNPTLSNPRDFKQVIDGKTIVREVRQSFLSWAVNDYTTMLDDLARLQLGGIRQIFIAMQSNPEALSRTARDKAKQMLEPGISQGERVARANEFFDRFASDLQDQLQKQGYDFLDQTWAQLKARAR